jgi:MYXO-CTERM domain-containing protein
VIARFAALFLLALLAPFAARASVVLDQSFLVQNPTPVSQVPIIAFVGEAPRPRGAPLDAPEVFVFGGVQTFTAGTRGFLDHIGFQAVGFSGNGLLVATLFDGDVLAGSTTAIGSSALPFGMLPPLGLGVPAAPTFVLDVRMANYRVDVGQRYSVVFAALGEPLARAGLVVGTTPRTALMPTGTNYGGGAFTTTIFGTPFPSTAASLDVGFESFVDVVPVPAPTAPLALLGAAAAFALRRRRSAP